MQRYLHTNMHAYIHPCMHTFHPYIHTNIHIYILTCIHAYRHTDMYADTCTQTRIHTYTHRQIDTHTYAHTHIHTHIHPYIHMNIFTIIHCMHHAWLHFCAFMHTWMRACVQKLFPPVCTYDLHSTVVTFLHLFLLTFSHKQLVVYMDTFTNLCTCTYLKYLHIVKSSYLLNNQIDAYIFANAQWYSHANSHFYRFKQ